MREQQAGGIKKEMGCFLGLCQCVGLMGEAWLRVPGTCGSRYLAGQAFVGWVLVLVVAAFGRNPVLIHFWLATGGWILVHKIVSAVRSLKGFCPHSRFGGVSLFARLGGNRLAVCVWEPLLVFGVGYVLIVYQLGYGGFFIYLSIAMFFSATHAAAAERAMVRAMNDARADQVWLSQVSGK